MNIPRIPNGFFQLCMKHEYFKRNSILQAHTNICEMIDSGLTRNPELRFPDLEPEFDDPPESSDCPKCEPLAKKFKYDFKESTSATPPESPDSDSDDNETIQWDKDSEGVEGDYEQCTMKKTKWFYEQLAENELEEYSELGEACGAEEIKEIISIRRIIDTPKFKSIHRPIESLRVLIGYRKLVINFHDSYKPTSISYMSSQEGCLVWYDDIAIVEKNLKYQSLAAGDFLYTFEDRNTEFEELEVDFEDYRKCDPPIWPFSSFFWKIDHVWRYWKRKLHIQRFVMKVFYDKDEVHNGQLLLFVFWNKINPEYAMSVKLRIWDASEVCERRGLGAFLNQHFIRYFYGTPLWNGIKTLDIMDERIIVNKILFKNFYSFDTVHMILPQNDFIYLVDGFEEMNQVPRGYKCTFILKKETFNFLRAFKILQLKILHKLKDVPREGVKIVDTKRLKNGMEVMLNELRMEIVFKSVNMFKVPTIPALKSKL
ncbi:hypothetical protein CAEBREN_02328 [Caenorhabditis brenneri]|uniref:Uncharacterized protein n=1 Tax=Caenorhabditis brenneri TaxID=135651 RepID=G0MMF4_CAEBE|nr:hypothetical protein CAEBREN_02328 [Caenorhabditis brenneri]